MFNRAIETGDASAMMKMGLLYRSGDGVGQDYGKALKWFKKAGEAGDTRGMYFAAMCYEDGRGVAKDHAEALKWYLKAADAGDTSAMLELGRHLYNDNRYSEAREWWDKALAEGDSKALNFIGLQYKQGHGVPKDLKEAKNYFRTLC
jgi:uncharacterized protein